jgi:hypothetical protein
MRRKEWQNGRWLGNPSPLFMSTQLLASSSSSSPFPLLDHHQRSKYCLIEKMPFKGKCSLVSTSSCSFVYHTYIRAREINVILVRSPSPQAGTVPDPRPRCMYIPMPSHLSTEVQIIYQTNCCKAGGSATNPIKVHGGAAKTGTPGGATNTTPDGAANTSTPGSEADTITPGGIQRLALNVAL